MNNIVFCLLLATLGFCAAQSTLPPFKLAFDYQQVEILKNDVLKPFLEEMPNLGLNWTLPVNISGVTGNISNLTVMNVTLDWDNTHLLTPYDNVGFAIEIKNLSTCIKYDAKLRLDKLPYYSGTDNYLTIESLDIVLVFGFVVDDSSYYTYIESATILMQDIDIQLSGVFGVISKVIKPIESEIAQVLSKVATNLIAKYNQTLIAQSAYGVSATLFDTLQVNLTFASPPGTFLVAGDTFASMEFNLEVKNVKTGEISPVASSDTLPAYIDGGLPIQFIIGEEMISEIVWAVFKSGKVNLTLSAANMPKMVPILLDTTDLAILFPNITRDWGAYKGVYLNVQAGKAEPVAFIRDGRLVLDVDLILNWYVDTSSAQYPKQGLANCTTCQPAYGLDMSAFVAVDVFGVNQTTIGARILDLNMNNMTLLYGKDIDPLAFQKTLNGLLDAIVEQLNDQITPGIQIPNIQLVELYGLNDISLFIGPNYLQFGLSLVPKNDTTFLPF